MTMELILLLGVMVLLSVAIGLVFRGRRNGAGSVNELLFSKTFSLLMDGDREAALANLRRLYTRTEYDVGVGLALGILSRRMGKNLIAVRTHRSLASRADIDGELRAMIHTQLCADYLACGLLDRSREALLQALRLKRVDEMMVRYGQQAYLRLLDWDGAFKLVNDFGKKSREPVAPRLGLIRCEQGRYLWEKGQPDDALNAFKKAISAHRGCQPAHLGFARCRRLLGHAGKAQAYLAKNLKFFVDDFWSALLEMKKCAIAMENHSAFNEVAQERLEAAPDDWQSRAVYASFLEDTGSVDEAVDQLLRCLETAPGALLLHRRTLLMLSRQPRAESVLHRYLKALDPAEVFGHLYECKACFYSSPEMLWSCPSCHRDYSFGPREI